MIFSPGVRGVAMRFTMLAMAFAVPEVEHFCFLEIVPLATCQDEAEQPYRKENLTEKFHGHPFNRGNGSLQLPSSPTARELARF